MTTLPQGWQERFAFAAIGELAGGEKGRQPGDAASGSGAGDEFAAIVSKLESPAPTLTADPSQSPAALSLPTSTTQFVSAEFVGMARPKDVAVVSEQAADIARLVDAVQFALGTTDAKQSASPTSPVDTISKEMREAWATGPYAVAQMTTGGQTARPMQLAVMNVETHFAPVEAAPDVVNDALADPVVRRPLFPEPVVAASETVTDSTVEPASTVVPAVRSPLQSGSAGFASSNRTEIQTVVSPSIWRSGTPWRSDSRDLDVTPLPIGEGPIVQETNRRQHFRNLRNELAYPTTSDVSRDPLIKLASPSEPSPSMFPQPLEAKQESHVRLPLNKAPKGVPEAAPAEPALPDVIQADVAVAAKAALSGDGRSKVLSAEVENSGAGLDGRDVALEAAPRSITAEFQGDRRDPRDGSQHSGSDDKSIVLDVQDGSTKVSSEVGISALPVEAAIPAPVSKQIAEAIARPVEAPSLPAQVPEPTRAHGKVRVLEIQLQPDNLGTVTVRMQMTSEGLQLHLNASRPETVEIIKRDREVLANLLRSAGYAADDAQIRVTLSDAAPAAVSSVAATSASSDGGLNSNNGGNGQSSNNSFSQSASTGERSSGSPGREGSREQRRDGRDDPRESRNISGGASEVLGTYL